MIYILRYVTMLACNARKIANLNAPFFRIIDAYSKSWCLVVDQSCRQASTQGVRKRNSTSGAVLCMEGVRRTMHHYQLDCSLLSHDCYEWRDVWLWFARISYREEVFDFRLWSCFPVAIIRECFLVIGELERMATFQRALTVEVVWKGNLSTDFVSDSCWICRNLLGIRLTSHVFFARLLSWKICFY